MAVDVDRHMLVRSDEAKQSFFQVEKWMFSGSRNRGGFDGGSRWAEGPLTGCPSGGAVAECFSRNCDTKGDQIGTASAKSIMKCPSVPKDGSIR